MLYVLVSAFILVLVVWTDSCCAGILVVSDIGMMCNFGGKFFCTDMGCVGLPVSDLRTGIAILSFFFL